MTRRPFKEIKNQSIGEETDAPSASSRNLNHLNHEESQRNGQNKRPLDRITDGNVTKKIKQDNRLFDQVDDAPRPPKTSFSDISSLDGCELEITYIPVILFANQSSTSHAFLLTAPFFVGIQ